MNGVIVDLVNGQAAALCDDGRVVKLQDAGYSLGQLVEVHERKRRTPLWVRWASTAAAAALLLVGAGGAAAYAMPYGVVSLDVNPSLEYTINRFDYVLRVEGVNEDGRELLGQMDTSKLMHRPIGTAHFSQDRLVHLQRTQDCPQLFRSDTAGTKEPTHAEKLVSALESGLRGSREDLEVRAVTVSEADIDAAHLEGMSAGRHRVLGELRESEGEGFSAEEWKDRPIHDILHRLENGPAGVPSQEDAHSARPEQPRNGQDTLPAMSGDGTENPESHPAQPSGEQPQAQQPGQPQNQQAEHPEVQQPQTDTGAHAPVADQPRQDDGSPGEMHADNPQNAGSVPEGGHGGGFAPGSGGNSGGGPHK